MRTSGRRRVVLAAPGIALFTLVLMPVSTALAHSQLVSSDPGAGQTVPSSPAEVRLVFSEPVDPAYTSLDVLDGVGHVVEEDVGAPDPADPRQFVAPLPALTDGAYTVSWRAISAADGHSTSGFITFGVGSGAIPAGAATSGSIDPHAGHGGAALVVEIAGRTIGSLGLMAALGLAVFAWVAQLEDPVHRRRMGWLAVVGLALGAIGGVMLAWTATQTGLVGAANANLIGYLVTSRSGQLLLVRITVGAVACGVGSVLMWRRRSALAVAAIGGLLGIALIALSSHAAAFATPVPVIAQAVHLIAASAWVGGLVGFAALLLLRRRPIPDLRPIVPRFSAVALVSVTLIAASGAYLDWVQTADPLSVASQYQLDLWIKIVLFLAALAIGAVNYLRAVTTGGRLGFDRRVVVEASLAVAVIGASGVLASGVPPSGLAPIPIAPAVSSAATVLDARLALAPGRAGPNDVVVTNVSVPGGDQLVLELQRLDQSIGSARIPLQAHADGSYVASGVPMASDSRWDATVLLDGPNLAEIGRARFTFGVAIDGVTEGEAAPLIDPAVLIGGLLILLALLAGVFALAGGSLPRTDARASRAAVLTGSVLALAFGSALIVGGVVR